MERGELKLNDFEGFEKFLFTNNERKLPDKEKWKKYLDKGYDPKGFCSPITNPIENVEFQLCHYAYWMVISVFNVHNKPRIVNDYIYIHCYACHLKRNLFPNIRCEIGCPIKNWNHAGKVSYCCDYDSYYTKWRDQEDGDRANLARLIATLEWVNPNEALRSATDDSAV